MSSGASALQTEKSGDEKADTMEKHNKLDRNADDNPVIKEKFYIQSEPSWCSEWNIRNWCQIHYKCRYDTKKLTTNQDPFSLKTDSNTEVISPSEVANYLSEKIKHIKSNNAKLLGKEGSPKQASKNVNK